MSANMICSIFAISSVPKSHIHMVIVLANFNAGYHDFNSDEPIIVKVIIASPY